MLQYFTIIKTTAIHTQLVLHTFLTLCNTLSLYSQLLIPLSTKFQISDTIIDNHSGIKDVINIFHLNFLSMHASLSLPIHYSFGFTIPIPYLLHMHSSICIFINNTIKYCFLNYLNTFVCMIFYFLSPEPNYCPSTIY